MNFKTEIVFGFFSRLRPWELDIVFLIFHSIHSQCLNLYTILEINGVLWINWMEWVIKWKWKIIKKPTSDGRYFFLFLWKNRLLKCESETSRGKIQWVSDLQPSMHSYFCIVWKKWNYVSLDMLNAYVLKHFILGNHLNCFPSFEYVLKTTCLISEQLQYDIVNFKKGTNLAWLKCGLHKCYAKTLLPKCDRDTSLWCQMWNTL